MKRYEKVLIISTLIMIFAGFGIVGCYDLNMEVGILPKVTFVISGIISGIMIYFQHLDNKD